MTDSVDTRQRLLEAAGQVFAEKGFKAATVNEICTRAEANGAAINYYFGGKERIYIEAVKHAHRCKTAEMSKVEWPEGTPPAVKLREFIRVLLTQMVYDDCPSWHQQLIMRELTEPSAACAELVRDNIRPVADLLISILQEMLPADMPLSQRYLIGFSIVGQCFFYRINMPIVQHLMGEEEFRKLNADLLSRHIADFTLAALGYEPPLAEKG